MGINVVLVNFTMTTWIPAGTLHQVKGACGQPMVIGCVNEAFRNGNFSQKILFLKIRNFDKVGPAAQW
jgi:hypothetical protein